MEQAPCPPGLDATKINNPEIVYFKPRTFERQDSKDQFRKICPGYDPEAPLCCNDDQVEIMCKIE